MCDQETDIFDSEISDFCMCNENLSFKKALTDKKLSKLRYINK